MENLTFDESMGKLESILDELESKSDSLTPEEIEAKITEAEKLRDHCKDLLKKEKEEIIKTARDNNIPLEDIGITADDDLDDYDDLEEEEEEE